MGERPLPALAEGARGRGDRRTGAQLRRVAQAYAEHLLAGGVTRWPEFLAAQPADGPVHGPAWSWTAEPPGAAQAELLRRLNRRAARGPTSALPGPDLGRHVLTRAAPGRGRVDLSLADPAEHVPVGELLRVGAGVLADLVVGLDLPTATPTSSGTPAGRLAGGQPGAPTGRGPTYRLEGPPLTVAALRRRLVAAGLPPRPRQRWSWRRWRRRPDVVLVVALPLRRALLEVWSRRTQRGATKSWSGLLAEWHAGRRLPPGAAYDRLAATWAGRIGARRVHVVTDDDLDGQVEAVLGRRPVPVDGPLLPAPLPAASVEVLRRTSEVLTFRAPPEEKQQRLELLVRLLADRPGRGGAAGGLPPRQREWVRRAGRRTAARLQAGGYVLHGPVTTLGRVGRSTSRAAGRARRPGVPGEHAVLAAMLESVLRAHAARNDDHDDHEERRTDR